MNELSTTTRQLPNTIEEVADFVVVNEEKLNAVKAAIRAARKTNDVKLDKLEEQRRELEVTVVLAQCKLGELTSSLQKAKNQYEVPSQEVGKQQQLAKIGITSQRASEYERMAAHPEAVQKVIEHEEHPTKADVMREIHDMTWGKDKSPRQIHKEIIDSIKQEREEFKEKKTDGTVSIKDVAQDRENASMLAMELWSRLTKMGKPISDMYLEFKENEIDIKEMVKVLPRSDIASLTSRIQMWQTQLNIFMEEITN